MGRISWIIVVLVLAGCNAAQKSPMQFAPAQSQMQLAVPEPAASAGAPRRYIAMRHNLVVEAPEDGLQFAWESTRTLCGKLQCEMTESSLQKKTDDTPGSASIRLRIAPGDLDKLFDHVGKAGVIVQHSSESEDKTAAVIDTEAALQNQTQYRDSLRSMLAKPAATFKDVLEVQRELVKVQSDLDALAGKRKVLAAETEKVAVQINFRTKQSFASRSMWTPIASAFRQSGMTFAESIAALITIVTATIPWLLSLMFVVWFVRRFGLRLLRRKVRSAS